MSSIPRFRLFGVALIAVSAIAVSCSSDTIGYAAESTAAPESAQILGADPDGLPPEDLAYVDDPVVVVDDSSADFDDEPYVWNGFLTHDGHDVTNATGQILVTCGSDAIDVEVNEGELINVVVESDGLQQFFGNLNGSLFSTPGEIDTVWVRVVGVDVGEDADGSGYGERFDC